MLSQSAPVKRAQPLHARIRYCGMAVLIVGLVSAALIYIFASGDGNPDPTAEITNARTYEYNVERLGGMAAVYMDRFNRWLAGLWHGKALAGTMAVLAIAIALLCFWVAHLVFVRTPKTKPDAN